MNLPSNKMPEAEVSLRLAFFLIKSGLTSGDISIAIDGAQIETKGQRHFEIEHFLAKHGWEHVHEANDWRGTYTNSGTSCRITIHCTSGQGDVVATLENGKSLRVECKKGPLVRSASSEEYPLIREAIGQIMTVTEAADSDVFAVCVPASEKFNELAERWREAPLINKAGLLILTVDRQNRVSGLAVGNKISEPTGGVYGLSEAAKPFTHP